MNAFCFVLCVGPLALYFFILTLIHYRSTPTVVSGRRDLLFLAVGLIGFFFVGPVQMLVPINAIFIWKSFVWVLVLWLYFFIVYFMGTFFNPRIILYNISLNHARSLLTEWALKQDFEARWAGHALNLPGLGIQLYLENNALLKNVSLVAAGPQLNPRNWSRLEKTLNQQVRQIDSKTNWIGKAFCGITLGLILSVLYVAVAHQNDILELISFYLFV